MRRRNLKICMRTACGKIFFTKERCVGGEKGRNMNSIYHIFDYNYIRQQTRQQHHNYQVFQVQDTVKKLNDFLDSLDKIESDYQNMASYEMCAVLFNYAKRHGMC